MKKMIMKRNLLVLLLVLMTSVPMLADVAINETNFPDANFRNYLLTNEDPLWAAPPSSNMAPGNRGVNGYGKDGKLTTAELNSIYCLNLSNLGISNLKGIEYFTNLVYLDCNGNSIGNNSTGTVNLSQNTKLVYLDLGGQQNLQSLDVSRLTSLQILLCGGNQLPSLDVSHNTYLSYLICSSGSFNFPSSNTLEFLGIGRYQGTSIDLSGSLCPCIDINSCDNLNSIALPTNTANLKTLFLTRNPSLTSLDVSSCTALEHLLCYENGITSLDVSNNTALKFLVIRGSRFTTLDVSHNTELNVLFCENNLLTSLDLSNNTKLTGLKCENNLLTELDLSQNTHLTSNNTPFIFYDISWGFEANGILNPDRKRWLWQSDLSLSPQILSKDYVAIDGRSKLGVQCNTNDGVLTSYGTYSAVTSSDDDNNYIVVGDGTTDVHGYNNPLSYNYNTGYTGDYDEAKTMAVNIGTSAHGMYVHPETLRGSDNFYSGTLYLEFPAKIPDGVQCYYATALDDNEDLVGLTEVTGTIPANTAVIVKAPSEYKFFAFNESSDTPDAPTNNIIEGTIEGLSVTPGTVLTLGHNVDRSNGEYDKFGFWDYRGSKISPFRAYIPKANLTAGAKSGFSLVFPEEGTTGIGRLTYGDATGDGTWYTLSGVRLNGKPTEKGIYVNNGKKTVIR